MRISVSLCANRNNGARLVLRVDTERVVHSVEINATLSPARRQRLDSFTGRTKQAGLSVRSRLPMRPLRGTAWWRLNNRHPMGWADVRDVQSRHC